MKKLITILGLLLIPISFSSGDFLDVSCQTFTDSSTMVVYDNTILTFRNGNFTTNRLNNSIEHVMWLTNKNFVSNPSNNNSNTSSFFAWYNGNPYIFAGTLGDDFQGFPQNVCVESLSGFNITSYGASMNCTSESINSFLLAGNINGGSICYPSTTNTYAYGLFTYCFYDDNFAYCFKITSYKNSPNLQVLTLSGSLNLPSRVNVSSLQAIEWGPSIFTPNTTPTLPPEQYTCPTAQQLINTYPEQYNTGLCYSSNIIYSGGTIQTITPKSIFELYPTRINLNQDVQNYNAYCNNATTTQACKTIFEGKTEEYTLIAKIPQNVMPMQLYAYCNLTLNMDPNQTTCTTSTGTINNGITMDDIIDNIGNSPITVISPGKPPEDEGNGTGSVFDKYTQQEEDTNRRNIIQKAEDTIQTMKEIYAKLTGIFRARQGSNGIIPPLITGLIALIVLYKLFKK